MSRPSAGHLPSVSPCEFRLGTTSYILPDHIVPNVEYLAPIMDDVELVLFETDEYGSNLPDAATVARLQELALRHGLTYTVHLPLDLRLGEGGSAADVSLLKARRVIEATRELDPYAYTLHLDGSALLPSATPVAVAAWQDRKVRALTTVSDWVEEPARLCIENVEGWDSEFIGPIMERLPVSRVIDVGHLWLQGVDPLEHLARWIHRTRVIHLHGIADRDHSSLAHVPPGELDPVVAFLRARFRGVLTLEVFRQDDLVSSLAAIQDSLQRIEGRDR
jgi:sugar phosphate isomerase/epimerase